MLKSYSRTCVWNFKNSSVFADRSGEIPRNLDLFNRITSTVRRRALLMEIDKAARVTAAVRVIPARKRRRKIKRRVEGKWKLI